MVTQTIKIDLTKDIITDHIIFKQGEIGREIEFEVYNDGVSVDLDGYDVTFSVYKPDGNFVIVSGTVDNDTVTVEETEQMTAVCGSGCFDLTLTQTNEVIYTFKGFIDIATPIVTRDTVNSVSMVFGLIFPDDFQEKLTAGDNITIIDNVISASGGGGGGYSAGTYISILNNVIDVKSSLISTINGKADSSALNGKQDKLTAGSYIDISNNVIGVAPSLITTINGKADSSDLNGKQDKLTAGSNINISEQNVISASSGTTYTAGTYIDITSDVIDVKSSLISTINGKADSSALNGKQDKLTAGTGITIDANNVISASGGGGSSVNMLYCDMTKTGEVISGGSASALTFWNYDWTGKTIKGFALESINDGNGTDVVNATPTKFTKDSDGHPLITFLAVSGTATVGGIKGVLFYE